MKRFLGLALLLTGLAWAKVNHVMTPDNAKRCEAEWSSSSQSIRVKLFDAAGKNTGSISFFPPSKVDPKSGKLIGPEDLETFVLTSAEPAPPGHESMGGKEFIPTFLKSFSAEMKPGGKVSFAIKGKTTQYGDDWTVDISGATTMSVR